MKIEISEDGASYIITIPRKEFGDTKGRPEVFPRMTAQQRKIFGLLIKGYVNKEIASEIGVSVRTVKFHTSAILKAFNVSSRYELVKFL